MNKILSALILACSLQIAAMDRNDDYGCSDCCTDSAVTCVILCLHSFADENLSDDAKAEVEERAARALDYCCDTLPKKLSMRPNSQI